MPSTKPSDLQPGADLRALRRLRGKTIAEVAEAMGKSSGWLSQAERGKSRIDAQDMQGLAAFLDVPPSLLVGFAPAQVPGVVRGDARRSYGKRMTGLQEELVTPGLDGPAEIVHARFEPRSARVTPLRSAAEEVIYILSGRLIMTVDGQATDLRRGDSMRLRDTPYSWENPAGAVATALWIITPPRY